MYLLGKPDAAGLSDPLSGVDSSVDPDGRTVGSPSAELSKQKRVERSPDCVSHKRK